MKEIDLQNAFEFGTQLMNKLTALKELEYRCISCNFTGSVKSNYIFNFEFASVKTKNKIKFSYYPETQSEGCHFDVNIESENGENTKLNKLVNSNELNIVELFYCDTYPGNFADKVHGFFKKINELFESQSTILQ